MSNRENFIFNIRKSAREITSLFWKVNSTSLDDIIIICHGEKMKTWQGFTDIFSAALQFPYYFSGGRDSFYECICDLDWIYKKRVFIFVTNFPQVMSVDRYEFFYLFENSVKEVPIDSEKYTGKNVYYILQGIEREFPLFENSNILENI